MRGIIYTCKLRDEIHSISIGFLVRLSCNVEKTVDTSLFHELPSYYQRVESYPNTVDALVSQIQRLGLVRHMLV